MNPNWRQPTGMLAILAMIAALCVLIASFSDVIGAWHWALQGIFYLIAGIAWIAPLKPLLRWMETGHWR